MLMSEAWLAALVNLFLPVYPPIFSTDFLRSQNYFFLDLASPDILRHQTEFGRILYSTYIVLCGLLVSALIGSPDI